jgi:hypothetical protein
LGRVGKAVERKQKLYLCLAPLGTGFQFQSSACQANADQSLILCQQVFSLPLEVGCRRRS